MVTTISPRVPFTCALVNMEECKILLFLHTWLITQVHLRLWEKRNRAYQQGSSLQMVQEDD
jgi:hypothetical protein